jgi:RimJ/RimL family protein N-acetyltransferase
VELSDHIVELRPPVESDLDALDAAVDESIDELAPFMPWATPRRSKSDTLAWIRNDRGSDEKSFVIVDPSGAILGACGLNHFDELNRLANLGYWLRTSQTGHGYATRAARLLVHHGQVELGLARIEILMSVENPASRRVAERVGARHEGVLRSRLLLHGRRHDAHLFSIVSADC